MMAVLKNDLFLRIATIIAVIKKWS